MLHNGIGYHNDPQCFCHCAPGFDLSTPPPAAWTSVGVNDPTCFRSGSQLHSQQAMPCMMESPRHGLSLQGRVSPEMSALESLEKMRFHSPFQAKKHSPPSQGSQ